MAIPRPRIRSTEDDQELSLVALRRQRLSPATKGANVTSVFPEVLKAGPASVATEQIVVEVVRQNPQARPSPVRRWLLRWDRGTDEGLDLVYFRRLRPVPGDPYIPPAAPTYARRPAADQAEDMSSMTLVGLRRRQFTFVAPYVPPPVSGRQTWMTFIT